MSKEETQLARIEAAFPVLQEESLANFREAMADNIGGEGINPWDLERVRMPSGGATSWEIPDITAEGGSTMDKELRGVIVHHHLTRLYWRESFEDGGGAPPDCFSPDAEIGYGDPGGECAQCPLAQFGPNDERPECSMRRMVYLLREGDYLPTVVSLSPASVAPSKKYLFALVKKGIPAWAAITSIRLTREKSKSGIDYAAADMGLVEVLDPETKARMKVFVEMIDDVIKKAQQSSKFASQVAS